MASTKVIALFGTLSAALQPHWSSPVRPWAHSPLGRPGWEPHGPWPTGSFWPNHHEPKSNFTIGQPVNTTSGLVHGHPAPNASSVSEYLGIPFAIPPVRERRFTAPERYYGNGNLSGLSTNRVCPQAGFDSGLPAAANITDPPVFLIALANLGQERSEDCLTVNVWTKPQTGSKKKPVMVWIYGGGYATGSSNSSAYSGQHWAEDEDVVFVNFNYRLSIFGFSGAPTLTQNVGLLDQRLAVEWVRDNIEAFGGDASRITLFGESAGAASTDYYTYIWKDDPIIAGSIHESGEAISFGNKPAELQTQRWYAVSTALGCGNDSVSTPEEVVACMRQVPTANLSAAAQGSGPMSLILANFGPTVDNITVFSNYTQLDIDGDFMNTPALVGNNDNEAAILELIYQWFGISQPQEAYDYLTKIVWTCPSNTAAYARSLHDVPVWRYRYFPAFPNIDISTSIGRAYHLSEVFPLFGTAADVSHQPSTTIEKALGDYMRRAWATFAHDPVNGLSGGNLKWPRYSPDVNGTKGLVLLGRNNGTGAEFSARGVYDGDCELLYPGLPGF